MSLIFLWEWSDFLLGFLAPYFADTKADIDWQLIDICTFVHGFVQLVQAKVMVGVA